MAKITITPEIYDNVKLYWERKRNAKWIAQQTGYSSSVIRQVIKYGDRKQGLPPIDRLMRETQAPRSHVDLKAHYEAKDLNAAMNQLSDEEDELDGMISSGEADELIDKINELELNTADDALTAASALMQAAKVKAVEHQSQIERVTATVMGAQLAELNQKHLDLAEANLATAARFSQMMAAVVNNVVTGIADGSLELIDENVTLSDLSKLASTIEKMANASVKIVEMSERLNNKGESKVTEGRKIGTIIDALDDDEIDNLIEKGGLSKDARQNVDSGVNLDE